MTDRYWVVGNPIEHSKSPLLHREFAAQVGHDIDYRAFCSPLDGFARSVDGLRRDGARGINVTVPFKIEALAIATELTERARRAEALNTLKFDGERALGDNTDGVGLMHDIVTRLGYPIAGARVLVMGAGGAARGILLPLLGERPAAVTIANRTPERAARLADAFAGDGPIRAAGYDELEGCEFDLVINATSASIGGEVPALGAENFAPDALAYDLMYGEADTVFMHFARECGVTRVADGLGMLVAQAAESFYLWRGVRVDVLPVLEKLRRP